MSLTTYAGNKLRDHVTGVAAYAKPTVWIGLMKTAPNIAGGGAECAYTGYARVAAAGKLGTTASLAQTNTSEVLFPTKTGGADETAGWVATFDAATGGNMLEFAPLGSPKDIEDGDAVRFLPGEIDLTAA